MLEAEAKQRGQHMSWVLTCSLSLHTPCSAVCWGWSIWACLQMDSTKFFLPATWLQSLTCRGKFYRRPQQGLPYLLPSFLPPFLRMWRLAGQRKGEMSLWVSQAFSSCALPISVQPSDSAAHSHTIQVSVRRGWCYTSHFKRSELFITSDLSFFWIFINSNWKGIPAHQSMFRLASVCKIYEGLKFDK